MESSDNPILVTGVPGRVGGVGSTIAAMLRCRDVPVRALVLHEDQRIEALRAKGVEELPAISPDLPNFHAQR